MTLSQTLKLSLTSLSKIARILKIVVQTGENLAVRSGN